MKKFLTIAAAVLIIASLSGCKKSYITIQHNEEAVESLLAGSPSKAKYTRYSELHRGKASSNEGIALLFFHAPWSPSSRILDQKIKENIEVFPPNVTILQADYEIEKELKEKFKVKSIHTFVLIDRHGEYMKRWTTNEIKVILENIEKHAI